MLASLLLVTLADAHAVLTYPPARTGQAEGVGRKLTPFDDFQRVIDTPGPDCGSEKGNPGASPGAIAATFTAGEEIDVSWLMTIAHDSDRLDYGVRIAVHYGPGDSYVDNVLVDNFDAGTGSGTVISTKAKLPEGKTSENAVLQWMWAARADGGFYLGCSDIRIVSANTAGQDPAQAPRGPADPNLAPPRGGAGENGGVNPVGGTRPGSTVGQPEDNGGIVRGSGISRTTEGDGTSTSFTDEAANNNIYYAAGGAGALLILVVLYFRNQDKKAEVVQAKDTSFQQMPNPNEPTVAVGRPSGGRGRPPPPPMDDRFPMHDRVQTRV